MPERSTAADQLSRILYILPTAWREDQGVPLADLAAALGVSEKQVARDVAAVKAREEYLEPGPAEDIQIGLETDRVQVWTKGQFRRPVRLAPREALALELGLRILAAEHDPERRAALLLLVKKLHKGLAVAAAEARGTRRERDGGAASTGDLFKPSATVPSLRADPSDNPGDAEILAVLSEARQERCWCVVEYVKPGAGGPKRRRLGICELVYAEGRWYTLALDEARAEVRLFRVDRMLSAELDGERFEPPADFDPQPWIAPDGRLYRADEDIEVVVRYSPRIARWLAERTPHEPQEDGGIVVCHRVADVRWIVRHGLQYGAEAEVLEPAEVRALVAEAAERLAALHLA